MTKGYQSPTPRAASAFVALALTAVTLAVWVIAPTKVVPSNAKARPLVESQAVVPAPAEATQGIVRLDSIDVVSPRQPALHTVFVHHLQPVAKHKQQS